MIRLNCDSYQKWCKFFNCDHAHCKYNCEKPQPFMYNGILFCGKCWYERRKLVICIACMPEVCK